MTQGRDSKQTNDLTQSSGAQGQDQDLYQTNDLTQAVAGQSQSMTQTYTVVKETKTQNFAASIMTSTGPHTQRIMRYLADDLRGLLKETGIDLADALSIPLDIRDNLTPSDDLADLICNDIEQMIRDRLITELHFLLSETQADPNTSFYNLKYHARYQIEQERFHFLDNVSRAEFDKRLKVPEGVMGQAKLVLIIDWSPHASELDKDMVSPPKYFFNWYPPSGRYDATRLVQYETGGLGMVVVRTQYTLPKIVPLP